MLALVKTQKGKGFLELKDMPEPRPGEGEVLLEIKASGICGTDLHVRDDNFPNWPPVILGHEFSGEIIELGLSLGVDYSLTHSCYNPGPDGRPCGHCDSCGLRNQAFAELGMTDPALDRKF